MRLLMGFRIVLHAIFFFVELVLSLLFSYLTCVEEGTWLSNIFGPHIDKSPWKDITIIWSYWVDVLMESWRKRTIEREKGYLCREPHTCSKSNYNGSLQLVFQIAFQGERKWRVSFTSITGLKRKSPRRCTFATLIYYF